MTPREFIQKWQNSQLKERAAAQEHFLDLCRLLNEPTPGQADPTGRDYGFEVGASKTTGGNGFADVFKRGHFGWEYKGTQANLDVAFAQLQRYAIALDNPPLLIVSDIGTMIRIHTNWTNSVSKVYEVGIAELQDPEKRGWLKAALSDPEALRPAKTRQELTEEVAGQFAQLARSLRDRGHLPEQVAHFINRLVFCMFAEDVKLLPNAMFTRMLERAREDPNEFENFARDLFVAMKAPGGRVGFEKVAWFNGGLFDDDLVFALTPQEIAIVHSAAQQYWGDIDPSILGTLFERGLDPDKRSQLGAHYTDRDKIMMIINPVIVEPLAAEWEATKAEITALMGKATDARGGTATRAANQAQLVLDHYLKRLADFRVLDPACGSGNFLYLALRALKDLEHRAQVEAEALGLPRRFPQIGPEVVKGIEINPYAAELARVSVWIGEIQWMLKNGFAAGQHPVLKPLQTIECRDALLAWDGDEASSGRWVEAVWPPADVIVGNPPFLGSKNFRGTLPAEVAGRIRTAFDKAVPASANLVMYWFFKAAKAIREDKAKRFGLVGTNAVRYGTSSRVLSDIFTSVKPYDVWADEPWVVDGAAVRVSIVCAAGWDSPFQQRLDGHEVSEITSKLTSASVSDGRPDFSRVMRLPTNRGVAFVGSQKDGEFDIDATLARAFLTLPYNPNGRPNSDVVRRWLNGRSVLEAVADLWIIDFGEHSQEEAALYEAPFRHIQAKVEKPRASSRDKRRREKWWLHGRPGSQAKAALSGLGRCIITPLTAKYRVYRYYPVSQFPDNSAVVIARDDDICLGLLHSRVHNLWFSKTCTWLGKGNDARYTPTTTFETFPFPAGLTPDLDASLYKDDPRAIAVALAARSLNDRRENWLNPADLIRLEPEVVPGFPDRLIPVDDAAAAILKKRTLTNLYNERPAWLDHAHRELDAAVAAAYGWPADLSDDEILVRLFELNQQRSGR